MFIFFPFEQKSSTFYLEYSVLYFAFLTFIKCVWSSGSNNLMHRLLPQLNAIPNASTPTVSVAFTACQVHVRCWLRTDVKTCNLLIIHNRTRREQQWPEFNHRNCSRTAFDNKLRHKNTLHNQSKPSYLLMLLTFGSLLFSVWFLIIVTFIIFHDKHTEFWNSS
jgi:hypothetical protein